MAELAILKHMAAVTDPIRWRLLRVLDAQELTVSELCGVMQLPQSTVSRHLKTLSDDGWIASRRDGTSRFYTMASGDLDVGARQLWELVEEQVRESEVARQDRERLELALLNRRSKSREFFSSTADQWDHLRSELFGEQFQFHALMGLLSDEWVVGDLGCGTGVVSELLASVVLRVIAVDGSAEMLDAARVRLQGFENVELRQGELDALPVGDGELDVALLMLVLHYVPDPARTLAEAARVLKRGGRLLIVEMLPHTDEGYQQRMGHVWLGFSEAQMARYLNAVGFLKSRSYRLTPDALARGPALFVATAVSG